MPPNFTVQIRSTPYIIRHPHACQKCEKTVLVRQSTPRIMGDDNIPRYWCKKCWKKIGGYR